MEQQLQLLNQTEKAHYKLHELFEVNTLERLSSDSMDVRVYRLLLIL